MARKWSNRNLPGALHFVTGNSQDRFPLFKSEECCLALIEVLTDRREQWPFKLIAYVLMPDHFHLVINPRDGRIKELLQALKSLGAKKIINAAPAGLFKRANADLNKVWQESFKTMPLWSPWMIWQKINYIHSNPLRAGLVKSVADYRWSSYRSFYFEETDPMRVDKEWWWPDDVRKLSEAAAQWNKEKEDEKR